MPKISRIDEVPCQAEVRILQKITLKEWVILTYGEESVPGFHANFVAVFQAKNSIV